MKALLTEMLDMGEDFETNNQQSKDSTSDAVGDQLAVVGDQLEAFGNINGNKEEADSVVFGGEEYHNPNRETPSNRTVVPEHTIQIHETGWSPLKVPAPMFKVDQRAYVPMIVSIGPFHHNEPSLRAMHTQKQRYLNRLVQNGTGQPIHEESLKNAMKELEGPTREFYANDFQTIKPDEFVQMMLLDGVFIVELLRCFEKDRESEPLFKTRWMQTNISRDLLLLENQLPMFVLQKIFELTTLTEEATLNTLALKFFELLRPGEDKFEADTLNNHANREYIHLLALFHSTLILENNIDPPQQPAKSDLMLPGKGWVRNAKTLGYAGIKLKKKPRGILDIEFIGKTLKIPTIVINDYTSPMLRNLIAYEQNNRNVAPCFCCFAFFLDSIVDTAEDVKILCDGGIIKHAMGRNEEVADLFNRLTKELVFDINEENCYMTKEIEKINRHCRAHDIQVRIRCFLNKLNYNELLTACFSFLITAFFINFQLSSDTSDAPPPSL